MKEVIESEMLKQVVEAYKKIFDIVQIVDPIKKKLIKYKDNDLVPSNIPCHLLWSDSEPCENCVSMKALRDKNTFVKIQHNADKMFLIFAAPIETNRGKVVLELLKDITDNLIFETIDQYQGHEVRNTVQDLNTLLLKDTLTNLYNRRYINQMLPLEIARSIENKYPLVVAMIDVDSFKNINDTYGHYIGDIVIRKFGQMLSRFIRREVDWVGRYGGDEFLICLHNVDIEKAYKILERMRKAIERTDIRVEDKTIRITGSFGMCQVKGIETTAIDIIKCADEKLYEAKNQGRNRVML